MANQFPTNNYSTDENQGQARTGDPLYADQHYLDGDGFLYGIGMIKQRVLAKPASSVFDGLGNGLIWTTTGINAALQVYPDDDYFDFSNRQLTLKATGIKSIAYNGISVTAPISKGGSASAGPTIGLNIGKGLYTGTAPSSTETYNKLNLNLFNKKINNVDSSAASGIEFITGTATTDGAPTSNQLRIKLNGMSATGSSEVINISGLLLEDPQSIGQDLSTTGGLRVNAGQGIELQAGAVAVNLSNNNGWISFGENGELEFTPEEVNFSPIYSASNPYVAGDPLGLSTGFSNIDNWTAEIPLASSSVPGVILTGYTQTGRNFPVVIDSTSKKAYVTVPSDNTDTWRPTGIYDGTTYTQHQSNSTSSGDLAFAVSNSIVPTFNANSRYEHNVLLRRDSSNNNISGLQIHTASGQNKAGLAVDVATSDYYGGIKIGYSPAVGSKTYAVQLSNGQAYVDVPWQNSTISKDTTSPNPIILNGDGDKTINFAYNSNNFDVTQVGQTTQYELVLKSATDTTLGGVKVPVVVTEGNQWTTFPGRIGIYNDTVQVEMANGNSTESSNRFGVVKLYGNQTLGSSATVSLNGANYYGLQLDQTSKKVFIAVPSANATNGNSGVTKLYDSVMGSSDTHTDGAPTQNAVHSAYVDLLGRITGATFHFEIYSSKEQLPQASSTYGTTIALVPQTHSPQGGSYYEEYVCINKGTDQSPNWIWEKLGDTDFELDCLTDTEVAAIVSDVFGF